MSILTNKTGLSITEDKVQLVEISKTENTYCLENVDEEYFEESLFNNTKEAKFIHILQNAFNELILRNPLRSNNISITIPPSYFKTFEIPADKNLTKNDLNDYIKWELSKLFPNEKDNHYTFHKSVLGTSNYKSIKKILVHAVPLNLLKQIHKFCVRNNLVLKLIDGSHTAISSFVTEGNTEKNILSVYLENNHISTFLFSGSNLLFERNKELANIHEISGYITSLINEISSEKIISNEINQIYFSGNSVTSEVKNNIAASTNIELGEINPFNNLNINEEIQDHKFITEHKLKFLPATAVALRIRS